MDGWAGVYCGGMNCDSGGCRSNFDAWGFVAALENARLAFERFSKVLESLDPDTKRILADADEMFYEAPREIATSLLDDMGIKHD